MTQYIIEDFKLNWLRATVEMVGMILALGVSLLLALTTPTPPMLYAYIGWLLSAVCLGACSWHRGSTGLTMTYAGFLVLDGYGFFKTIGVIHG